MDEDERQWATWKRQPGLEQEWIRQNNLMYGGLAGIGIVFVQPFLTASSLDLSAWICVVAFSVAIPLLAGLVLLAIFGLPGGQESVAAEKKDTVPVASPMWDQVVAVAGVALLVAAGFFQAGPLW